MNCIYHVGQDPQVVDSPLMLVIDPEECIQCGACEPECFSGDTLVVTAQGIRDLESLAGTSPVVLSRGRMVRGEALYFGAKKMLEVEFQPVHLHNFGPKGLRYSRAARSSFRRMVKATSGHRWPTMRGLTLTSTLVEGDIVPAAVWNPAKQSDSYRRGFRHGFVFGDGRRVTAKSSAFSVDFYGCKDEAAKWAFDDIRQRKPDARVAEGLYRGTAVLKDDLDLKRIPPQDLADPDHIAGFVDGWRAADGGYHRSGSAWIESTSHEALDWLELHLPLAGYMVLGRGEHMNLVTNKGVRTRTVKTITFASPNGIENAWRVNRVRPSTFEESFCLTVPGSERFVLAGGIETMNCPVEAISIDSMVPSKWEDFIGLNAMIAGRGANDGPAPERSSDHVDIAEKASALHSELHTLA